MAKMRVILAIDDDEDNRAWAQYVHLGKPVLTGTCESAWDNICRLDNLHAILINIENYERGLVLAMVAVEAGCLYAGVISATLPDALDRATFCVNSALVILNQQDNFLLEDGLTDWVTLYESLTTKGPILAY